MSNDFYVYVHRRADDNLPFGLYELSTSIYVVLVVHENVTFNATHSITGKLILQRD